ncbi:Flp pilus assembly protein TadG [Catenulispora sp. GP43]|uniref:TadE family protein n=1 Tax=Catenulispora sp. GP43 TaxID=3156263 RepID=UPI003518A702
MTDGVKDGTESRGGRSLRDDRGMTAIEFVILTPLLFLMLMLTVQFALYLFAKQAATAAVQEGARKAREEAAAGTLPQDCDAPTAPWQQDAVNTAIRQSQILGGQLLLTPTATTSFTADPNLNADCKISLVRVDLHSNVPSVFPGFGLAIDVHAGGPVEQPVRHP